MRYKIGVMGKAGRSRKLSEKIIKSAEIVGKEIAKENCILVTGACMGVPEVASAAASKQKGLILGYSPARNLKEHLEPPISYPRPSENEELIFTGQGKIGRNVLAITEADGAIFIGGGIGTLNEYTVAYHENKVIGILEGVGGITEKALRMEKEMIAGTGKEIRAVILKDKDPRKLVHKVLEEIKKRDNNKRKEVPLTFRNKREKELAGILHIPEEEKPPLVVMCHGFQNSKTDKKAVKMGRALQEKGICVFRFDFEGCGDSQGEAKEATIKKWVEDLDVAIKTTQKEVDLDMTRVAFIGISLGSVIASLFAKESKIPIKTMVFWSQGFDQKSLLEKWHDGADKEKIKREGVVYKKDKEIGRDYYLENKNKDYSPVLSELKLPILIIHGKEDKDVPFHLSWQLEKKHKNIALIGLLGANHKFNDYSAQNRLIKETLKWIKKHLKVN